MANGQDVVTGIDGKPLECTILDVSQDSVYLRVGSYESSLPRNLIDKFIYKNGLEVDFGENRSVRLDLADFKGLVNAQRVLIHEFRFSEEDYIQQFNGNLVSCRFFDEQSRWIEFELSGEPVPLFMKTNFETATLDHLGVGTNSYRLKDLRFNLTIYDRNHFPLASFEINDAFYGKDKIRLSMKYGKDRAVRRFSVQEVGTMKLLPEIEIQLENYERESVKPKSIRTRLYLISSIE